MFFHRGTKIKKYVQCQLRQIFIMYSESKQRKDFPFCSLRYYCNIMILSKSIIESKRCIHWLRELQFICTKILIVIGTVLKMEFCSKKYSDLVNNSVYN